MIRNHNPTVDKFQIKPEHVARWHELRTLSLMGVDFYVVHDVQALLLSTHDFTVIFNC